MHGEREANDTTLVFHCTFEEAEFLEESRDHEGVTEVKQQATEHQALMAQVGGVWTRVDVAHGNLGQKRQDRRT